MTATNPLSSLTSYTLLGRTGLRVSPFCLGAMTFGNGEGWGAEEPEARKIFDYYLDAGGNFIDTANVYAGSESETLLGKFLAESGKRDRVAVATKFSISSRPGDPNAGGNGRKNIYQALDASLKRLKTDYIDLYWLHYWDVITPIDEVIDTISDLVRSGKVRYFGMSDVPAWYVARAQTYAELRGGTKIAALQLEYSLLDRSIENEHVDAAQELGIGICPWGSLGSGLLTGKYSKESPEAAAGRINTDDRYRLRLFNERNFKIVDTVVAVAKELGKTPGQVATNWITKRPAIRSTIVGATKLSQLQENLAALEFEIPAELSQKLDEASRPHQPHLYDFFQEPFRDVLRGAKVATRPSWDPR